MALIRFSMIYSFMADRRIYRATARLGGNVHTEQNKTNYYTFIKIPYSCQNPPAETPLSIATSLGKSKEGIIPYLGIQPADPAALMAHRNELRGIYNTVRGFARERGYELTTLSEGVLPLVLLDMPAMYVINGEVDDTEPGTTEFPYGYATRGGVSVTPTDIMLAAHGKRGEGLLNAYVDFMSSLPANENPVNKSTGFFHGKLSGRKHSQRT